MSRRAMLALIPVISTFLIIGKSGTVWLQASEGKKKTEVLLGDKESKRCIGVAHHASDRCRKSYLQSSHRAMFGVESQVDCCARVEVPQGSREGEKSQVHTDTAECDHDDRQRHDHSAY